MFQKFFKAIRQHKIISVIVALAIIGGGYYGYTKFNNNSGEVRYVLAAIEKGTLITSISGSGQVSASNQVDVKPKVSGDVVYVGVKNGQEVKTGALLVQIDSREAQKILRDAQTALETVKLEQEELLQPVDAYSLMQAENALIQAEDNLTKLKFTQESNYQKALDAKQKAEDNLKKAYEDGFNATANVFLDLPSIMAGLNDMLFANTLNSGQWNIDYYADAVKQHDGDALQYRDDSYKTYSTARDQYDQSFANYKLASRFSDQETIEKLISQTYEAVKIIAEAIKSANNLIQFYQDKLIERNLKPASLSDTYLSSLNTYTSKTNSQLSSLLGVKRNIQDSQEAIVNADRDIKEMNQNQPLEIAAAERTNREKEESLAKLKAEPDKLEVRAKQIAVQQKQEALLAAQQNLAEYYIRAPFDGVVAKVNAKKGESISSAGAAVTLITKQKIAEIPLNEVDIAKVKIGQKATLTFDAIEGLSITGEAADIDTFGTITQGVVTYQVKIVFDTQDERVKPGMSISAAIITNVKQNVLLVPNSAVKFSGGTNYVEMLDSAVPVSQLAASIGGITSKNSPKQQPIQIGLTNDSMTEVVDGLKESDQIVTQSIGANNTNTTQTQSQSSTGFRIPGFGGMGR